MVHYVVSRVGSYWSLDDEMNEEDEVYLRTVMALSFLGDAVVAAAGDRKRKEEARTLETFEGPCTSAFQKNAGCCIPPGFTTGAGNSIFHAKTLTLLLHSSAYTVRQATTHLQHRPMR